MDDYSSMTKEEKAQYLREKSHEGGKKAWDGLTETERSQRAMKISQSLQSREVRLRSLLTRARNEGYVLVKHRALDSLVSAGVLQMGPTVKDKSPVTLHISGCHDTTECPGCAGTM